MIDTTLILVLVKDFASATLYNLITLQLQKRGFDVSEKQQFSQKIHRSSKADILAKALDKLGSSAILEIGNGIHQMPETPMLTVFTNAQDVSDLIERWQRLEVYYHANHRVRLVESGCNTVTLEHYSISHGMPSEGEDLVIAGLLAALFVRIGVTQLNLVIGNQLVISDGVINPDTPRISNSAHWHFSWSKVECGLLDEMPALANDSFVERVTQLLQTDLGRTWKLASVASALLCSTRTLQRKLSKEGVSFQTLLRSVRADAAALMLMDAGKPLADIGFQTGFSDQAHFSRDFKTRFNMTPVEYRSLNL